ncbi:MAG: hypothetical protein JSS30_06555 [Verrucomicrobia bacterium]|nr:hypothetical protein [Verrucomicrobiota bacterium]
MDPLNLVPRGRPYVTKKDFKEIKQMEERVEGKQGITIMTFFKGRTLQEAHDSAGNPKEGNVTQFTNFAPKLLKRLGKVQCPKTITVVIANGILEGSRGLGVSQRMWMLEDLKCRPLTLREAVDFGLMVYRMSPADAPVRLFGDDPKSTHTLCVDEEKNENSGRISRFFSNYGNFVPAGPDVSSLYFAHHFYGVSGLREFKVRDL